MARVAATHRRRPVHPQPLAALYVRVSTTRQEEEGTSLETQLAACRAHAAQRDYQVDEAHVYREVYTGTDLWQRPGLSALREAIRARAVDVVIAYAIDRLSRDPVHLGVLLTEADHAGARVEFVTEPLDDSPEGQLIRFVRGYAAKVEHEKISERTQRGRRARVDGGKLMPGKHALYGYRFSADRTRYEVVPAEALAVRHMYEWLAAGASLYQVAARLIEHGIPTRSGRPWLPGTIRKMVRRTEYIGEGYAWRWRVSKDTDGQMTWRARPLEDQVRLPEGTVPPIIDVALWTAVQQRLDLNRQRATRNNRDPEATLLRGGYVRCGHCGWALRAHRHRGRHGSNRVLYACPRRGIQRDGMPVPTMTAELLDKIVWDKVEGLLSRPELIAREVERQLADQDAQDTTRQDLDALDRQLAQIARRQANLVGELQQDLSDSVKGLIRQNLSDLDGQRTQLEAERTRLLERRVHVEQARQRIHDMEAWCRQVHSKLGQLTYHDKRLALDALAVQVTVYAVGHEPRYVIEASVPLDPPYSPPYMGNLCQSHMS